MKNSPDPKFSRAVIIIIVFLVVVSLLIKEASKAEPQKIAPEISSGEIKQVKIAGATLNIELAITPEAQTQGLSGRVEMKENTGMLFVFEQVGKHGFWMKDMNFPIDMIWIGEDLRVTFIKTRVRPESYPQIFGESVDSRYVLEVVSGFSEKNNLKVGDKVEFVR